VTQSSIRIRLRLPSFILLILLIFAPAAGRADAVWQYSVPAPTIKDRIALLWIPQRCKRVRGVIVACQNMLEQPLFERPAFREAAAENDLAILLITSGHDRAPDDSQNPNHPKRSSLDIFLNPNYPNGAEDPAGAGADLQAVLNALADKSGYSELRYAPLMPVGHSSAGSFVWHLYEWDSSRIFAMMPFKTGSKSDGPAGIPVMMIESEWFDYGGASNNVWSKGSLNGRGANGQCLFGYYVDFGAGHCNVSDDSMKVVAMFLKKAVAARIPADAPLDGPVPLKPVSPESGWLLDGATIGQPGTEPVAYADWKGDPTKAYWYLDKELAQYVQDHMAAQLAKKPQQINFYADGGAPSTDGGTYVFSPTYLPDGETFKVQATYIDTLTKSDLYPPGAKLDNSGMPILYRVSSGALAQVGPDTFRIRPHAGPIVPQGNPWEPTIVAYTLGNEQFRPTERPAHVNVNIVNTSGQPQTIDFPTIPDQRAGSAKPISLNATATSGLPVQYYVISGPVTLTGDGQALVQTPIPPRSKYPVEVLVGAYQWGRSVAPQVQSAGPVTQQFLITK
jgi:hypothetical protein